MLRAKHPSSVPTKVKRNPALDADFPVEIVIRVIDLPDLGKLAVNHDLNVAIFCNVCATEWRLPRKSG